MKQQTCTNSNYLAFYQGIPVGACRSRNRSAFTSKNLVKLTLILNGKLDNLPNHYGNSAFDKSQMHVNLSSICHQNELWTALERHKLVIDVFYT